jgi:hypothetical protein
MDGVVAQDVSCWLRRKQVDPMWSIAKKRAKTRRHIGHDATTEGFQF